MLPVGARKHGLRPLIRDFVHTAGRLTCSGRRLRLLFGRDNLRLPWLPHTAGKLEPAGWRGRESARVLSSFPESGRSGR